MNLTQSNQRPLRERTNPAELARAYVAFARDRSDLMQKRSPVPLYCGLRVVRSETQIEVALTVGAG